MRFCRFLPETKPQGNAEATYGLLEGDTVREIHGMPWRKWTAGNRTWLAKECRLLAPVEPSKIVLLCELVKEESGQALAPRRLYVARSGCG